MTRNLLILIALGHVLTGVLIFVAPTLFYDKVPGVAMLGPYNVHFIRDAGLSYLASGLLLAWGWREIDYRWCVAGGLWPLFHAVFHLQMWMARGVPLDLVALVNLLGIQLPAWAGFVVALRLVRSREGVPA